MEPLRGAPPSCVLSGLRVHVSTSALQHPQLRQQTERRHQKAWFSTAATVLGVFGPHSHPGLGVHGPGSGLAREGAPRGPAGVQGDSGPLRPHHTTGPAPRRSLPSVRPASTIRLRQKLHSFFWVCRILCCLKMKNKMERPPN